jgi:hypothetical protein
MDDEDDVPLAPCCAAMPGSMQRTQMFGIADRRYGRFNIVCRRGSAGSRHRPYTSYRQMVPLLLQYSPPDLKVLLMRLVLKVFPLGRGHDGCEQVSCRRCVLARDARTTRLKQNGSHEHHEHGMRSSSELGAGLNVSEISLERQARLPPHGSLVGQVVCTGPD